MCYSLVTYNEWLCGWRENTGRHRVDCNQTRCRLSKYHPAGEHNCEEDCVGVQIEVHHLIMERLPEICQPCTEHGRGQGEHPGIENTGGVDFRHVVANYP